MAIKTFGLSIGDRILIGRDKYGNLIDVNNKHKWSEKYPTIGATIIGDNGLYLLAVSDFPIDDCCLHSGCDATIDPSFAKFNTNQSRENRCWYITSKRSFIKVDEEAKSKGDAMLDTTGSDGSDKKKPKKVKNTIKENEALGLKLNDQIIITAFDKEVWGKVVGFHPDGRPLVYIEGTEYGNTSSSVYKEGLHYSNNDIEYDVVDDYGRFWYLSNNPKEKNFKHKECLGLQLGDKVQLGCDDKGSIILKGDKEWASTVEGVVIGFKNNSKGIPIAPLIGIADRKKYKLSKATAPGSWTKDTSIDPSLRKEWQFDRGYSVGFNLNKAYCFLTKDTKFNHIKVMEKGEKPMQNKATSTGHPFWEMLKTDAKDAGYRIAATQITKGAKSAILTLLTKQGGSSEGIKAVSEMLDTEYGSAVVSMVFGLGGHYIPLEVMKDPRMQRISEEFRVNAMAGAGNAIMTEVMELLVPVMIGALAQLPSEEETTQKRVAAQKPEELEEEYHHSDKKTMSA